MQFTNIKTHILNSLINGALELFGNKKTKQNNTVHLKKKYQNFKKYISMYLSWLKLFQLVFNCDTRDLCLFFSDGRLAIHDLWHTPCVSPTYCRAFRTPQKSPSLNPLMNETLHFSGITSTGQHFLNTICHNFCWYLTWQDQYLMEETLATLSASLIFNVSAQ